MVLDAEIKGILRYYDVYLSQVILDEIEKCFESKRNKRYDYSSDIEYTKLEINEEIVELAQKIKIREQNYERTKDMTVAEKVVYYNNSGKEGEREIERKRALKRKAVASM